MGDSSLLLLRHLTCFETTHGKRTTAVKLYLALNEAGTRGDIGLHTKLAVLSARKHTKLQPHLLYTGERNAFTEWLERQGVTIIDSHLPYLSVIKELVAENKYTLNTVGHWLRTNVCLEELQDEHVFYTDVDVLFLKDPALEDIRPRYFAAAPEFDKDSWNYFNAGVMVVNPRGLRENYREFEAYLIKNIREKTYAFHDQIAYNQFYRGRWDRLPLELNWKPYWGFNPDASIVHFHGPKVGAMQAIIEERWNWASDHGKQIGSMFLGFMDSYLASFESIKEYLGDLEPDESDKLSKLFEKVSTYDRERHKDEVSLNFMKFRMFPEN
jgi:lipopolysaccharide biosynthesis glycosyltransferase